MAGGHPSDSDREEAARPALVALTAAATAADRAALAALYRDDVVWLSDGQKLYGRDAAADRHLALAEGVLTWDQPQQQGARAVLRWSRADGGRAALVVEVRGGQVVFAAAL